MKLEYGEPACNYGNCEAAAGTRGVTNCIHCGKELRERDGDWYTWDAPADGGVAQDRVRPASTRATKEK